MNTQQQQQQTKNLQKWTHKNIIELTLRSIVNFVCDPLEESERERSETWLEEKRWIFRDFMTTLSSCFFLLEHLRTVLKMCTHVKVEIARVMLEEKILFHFFSFLSARFSIIRFKLEPENNNFFNLFFVLCCCCFYIHKRCMWIWDWRMILDFELGDLWWRSLTRCLELVWWNRLRC